VDAHWIRFSIEQIITTLSAKSRITSSSYSFQPSSDLSIRIWDTGLADTHEPLLQILPGCRQCLTTATHREGRADNEDKNQSVGRLPSPHPVELCHGTYIYPNPLHCLFKQLTVFGFQLPVACQLTPRHTFLRHHSLPEPRRYLERFAPHRRQQSIWSFLAITFRPIPVCGSM